MYASDDLQCVVIFKSLSVFIQIWECCFKTQFVNLFFKVIETNTMDLQGQYVGGVYLL